MAERRMFAKTVIESDLFVDMPLSAQALYLHLAIGADDDGFVNNPKKVQRMIGGNDDDMKLLIAKGFVIVFDSGVLAIRHWKMHNYIQNDRYRQTVYQTEKAMLTTTATKEYMLMDTTCIQTVSNPDTQDRIGKDSIEIGQVRREVSSSWEEDAEADVSTIVYYMDVPVRQGDYLEFQRFAEYLTKRYWDRKATDHDKQYVYEQVRQRTVLPGGEAVATMDTNKKELLERAFSIAMDKGAQAMNWHYVFGVLARWERMELHTVAEIEQHEYQRMLENRKGVFSYD